MITAGIGMETDASGDGTESRDADAVAEGMIENRVPPRIPGEGLAPLKRDR